MDQERNDTRFYVLCLLSFGTIIILAYLILNTLQPEGVDVEVWKQIFIFAGIILGPIIAILNAGAAARKLASKAEKDKQDVKQEVKKELDEQTADIKKVIEKKE